MIKKKYSNAQLIKWQTGILTKVMKGEVVKKCGRPVGIKEQGKRLQPERDLRIQVMKYARSKGYKVWRIENSLSGYRGLPDLIVARDAKFMFVELKSPTGVVSNEQAEFSALCYSANVNHHFIYSLEHFKSIC